MRRLNEERTRILMEKLSKYIGSNLRLLIERPDGIYCFREHKNRIYYMSENILKLASTLKPDQFISCGTCIGKFTSHSNKFKLHITALSSILAPYCQRKIWVKPSAEQQFLYGHNVTKSGLGRISENIEKFSGIVVYSMNDLPLGFGLASRSTAECKHTDPLALVALHQADIGEYIRSENELI